MRFKLLGLLFLLAGMVMVVAALLLVAPLKDAAASAQVYCLAAIFLAITVRVLQAERHHRIVTHPKPAEPEFPLTIQQMAPDELLDRHPDDFAALPRR